MNDKVFNNQKISDKEEIILKKIRNQLKRIQWKTIKINYILLTRFFKWNLIFCLYL